MPLDQVAHQVTSTDVQVVTFAGKIPRRDDGAVPHAAQHKAAEATARLILTTARAVRDKIRRRNRKVGASRPPQKSTATGPTVAANQQLSLPGKGRKRSGRGKRRQAANERPRSTLDK